MCKSPHAARLETDLRTATHCQPPASPVSTFPQTAQCSWIATPRVTS